MTGCQYSGCRLTVLIVMPCACPRRKGHSSCDEKLGDTVFESTHLRGPVCWLFCWYSGWRLSIWIHTPCAHPFENGSLSIVRTPVSASPLSLHTCSENGSQSLRWSAPHRVAWFQSHGDVQWCTLSIFISWPEMKGITIGVLSINHHHCNMSIHEHRMSNTCTESQRESGARGAEEIAAVSSTPRARPSHCDYVFRTNVDLKTTLLTGIHSGAAQKFSSPSISSRSPPTALILNMMKERQTLRSTLMHARSTTRTNNSDPLVTHNILRTICKKIKISTKQERIRDTIHTVQHAPKQGISQNQYTCEPANTSMR